MFKCSAFASYHRFANRERLNTVAARVFSIAMVAASLVLLFAVPAAAKITRKQVACPFATPEAALDRLRAISSRRQIIRFASTTADCSTEAPDPVSNRFLFVSAEAFLKVANTDKKAGKSTAVKNEVEMARGLLRFLTRSHETDRVTRQRAVKLLQRIDAGHNV